MSASRTDGRLTPSCFARSRSGGRRSPASYSPFSMSAAIWSAICRYRRRFSTVCSGILVKWSDQLTPAYQIGPFALSDGLQTAGNLLRDPDMNRLQGKTALVTASGQGMGRAAVLAFAREGANVIATDVKAPLLETFKGKPNIRTATLDVLDDKAVAAFVEQTGPVDILFNCAGWVHQGTLLECTVEDWDRSFDLNVRSMFVMTKAMLPKMAAKGGGVILNMASVLGAGKAAPNRLAYA